MPRAGPKETRFVGGANFKSQQAFPSGAQFEIISAPETSAVSPRRPVRSDTRCGKHRWEGNDVLAVPASRMPLHFEIEIRRLSSRKTASTKGFLTMARNENFRPIHVLLSADQSWTLLHSSVVSIQTINCSCKRVPQISFGANNVNQIWIGEVLNSAILRKPCDLVAHLNRSFHPYLVRGLIFMPGRLGRICV